MSRVVVIGNAGLDLPLAVSRLPLPGETLIGRPDARAPGGKALNQAVVAARCGGAVRFCAPLGDDDAEAAVLEGYLRREDFAELHLPRLPHPTDFSLLMVLPGGENSIVGTSACSLALTFAQAEPALHGLQVMSSCCKATWRSTQPARSLPRHAGKGRRRSSTRHPSGQAPEGRRPHRNTPRRICSPTFA